VTDDDDDDYKVDFASEEEFMTAEERNKLDRARNFKAVRVGIYDVGIVLGAILLADKADLIWGAVRFWQHAGDLTVRETAICIALILWIGLIVARYRDWHAVDHLEKSLDRDELERRAGVRLTTEEAKNLGLHSS
jgi:hypothetical protein